MKAMPQKDLSSDNDNSFVKDMNVSKGSMSFTYVKERCEFVILVLVLLQKKYTNPPVFY